MGGFCILTNCDLPLTMLDIFKPRSFLLVTIVFLSLDIVHGGLWFQAFRSSGFKSQDNYKKVSYNSETGTSQGTSSFNYGNGIFHCPASGTYKFDFRAVKDDDGVSARVRLMKKTPGYNAAV